MNIMNEEHQDEFERQLQEFSVARPSPGYQRLAREIAAGAVKPFWQSWRILAGSMVSLTALVVVAVNLSGPAEVDTPAAVPAVSESIAGNDPAAVQESGPSAGTPYLLGTHYRELDTPAPLEDSSVSQICIFISYPCFPCFQFNAVLADWQDTRPEGIQVTQIPAIWSDEMRHYARVYYTAETLGVLDMAHTRIYETLHEQNGALEDEAQLAAFFATLGVSTQAFLSAFNSEATRIRVEEAVQANRDHQVRATPVITVNGRYVVLPGTAGGFPEMLEIAQYLATLD